MVTKVLSTDDPLFEAVDRRVRIVRDEIDRDWRDEWGHLFIVWSHDPVRFASDRDAESPIGDDGRVKPGIVAFPVSCSDHSCKHYILGTPPKRTFDDIYRYALWIYTDEELYREYFGGDRNAPPFDPGNADFVDYLGTIVKSEVHELNCAESGDCYCYVDEKKVKFEKRYEDGRVENGHEWDELGRSGRFVTDDPKEMFIPSGVPVFSDCPYMVGKKV